MRRLTLAILLAAACATGDGMATKLQDATSGYNRYLRWGDTDRAAEYLPQTSRNEFLTRHEDLREDLVIVEYDVTRIQIDKVTGTATSMAELKWHTDRRLILETTKVEQVWQWHEGGWILVDERRSGGTPLALFVEPEEPEHPYLPGLEEYRKANEIGDENKDHGKRKRKRGAARGTASR